MSSSLNACKHNNACFADGMRTCVSCGLDLIDKSQADQVQEVSTIESNAPEKYQYQPLHFQEGQQIRLIRLHPGDEEDPLECDIIHVNLEQFSSYNAISYTWATENGNSELSHVILCSKRQISISMNCDAMLRQLRQGGYHRNLIWVDAISIQQSNILERNHQVGLMEKIYRQAERVMICLPYCFHELGQILYWLCRSKPLPYYLGDSISRELSNLLSYRWFSRVWVIQEFALSRNPILLLGNGVLALSPNRVERLRKICSLFSIPVPGPFMWTPASFQQKGLLEALRNTRNCSAVEPRDKVYGILSLMHENVRSLIAADYSKSVAQVYTQACAVSIVQNKDLEFLKDVNFNSDSNDLSLPSWVPDWTDQSTPISFPPADRQRHASTPWKSHVIVAADWNSALEGAYKILPPREIGFRPYLYVRAHYADEIQDPSGRLRRLREIGCPKTFAENFSRLEFDSIHRDIWLVSIFFGVQLINKRHRPYYSPCYPFNSPFTGDSYFGMKNNLNSLAYFGPENVRRFRKDFILKEVEENWKLRTFLNHVIQYGQGKRLFATNYSVGFASCNFQPEDEIFLLDGASNPCILRECSEGGYTMVGQCYLWGAWEIKCRHNRTGEGREGFSEVSSSCMRTRMIEIY